MTPEQWQSVEGHFAAIGDLPESEREGALAAIPDDVVRAEVASLLRHSTDGETVAAAIGAVASRVEETATREQRIGPYKLVRRLGQGGQGAVFEAVRDDGSFQQRVAIKLIKWETDSEGARERFRQERQILAGLEHPHIARLLDGGETSDGAPYLVIEYVDGQPLTTAARDWPLRKKLQLFLEVAEAVTFAHRNLIVHRDLKPANILVTKEGSPKLLDFGIAKLLDSNATRTMTGLQALTPDYASPEQVRGEPITTASDVYSLGVVLYELLTERRPYQIATVTALEMDRIICQQAPASPELGEELDTIVLMAMRKEPARRYGSVQEFADDIGRYLANLPVKARPDTIVYRTRKYVRRHWVVLLAASVALAGICVGAGVAVYQARIAQQRFDQVRKLAHSFVFDYHDELAKVQGNTAVREKMVRTALEYLDMLSRSAGNDRDLQAELAAAYRKVGDAQGNPAKPNLGHIDQAIASYRKAAEIYGRLGSAAKQHREELSEFYTAYMSLLMNAGRLEDAARMGDTARQRAEELAAEQPGRESAQICLARVWEVMGDIDDNLDRDVAALEKYRRAETVARKVLTRWQDLDALTVAEGTQSRIGTMAQAIGRLSEALAAFDEDQKLLEQMLQLAPRNPGFHRSLGLLAEFRAQTYDDDVFPSMENPAKSATYARQDRDEARNLLKDDPNDASAEFTLGISLYKLSFPLKYSDPAGAVAAAAESVGIFDKQIAAGKKSYLVMSRRLRALHRLAEALLFAGRMGEARGIAEKALVEERELAVKDDPELHVTSRLVLSLVTSAQVAEGLHDRKAAEAYLAEAVEMGQKAYSRSPTVAISVIPLAHAQEALAAYWKRAGDEGRSRHWTAEALRLWRELPEQNEFVRRQEAKLEVEAGGR